MYEIFNTYIGIISDIYKNYMTNNFENLVKKKNGLKNTFLIKILVVNSIEIYM